MAMLDTAQPGIVDKQVLTSAMSAKNRPSRSNALSASLTLTWRAWLKLKHVPSQLVGITIFPILMTLMMTFLFGGALAGSVQAYVQHLIPGMIVLTVTMSTANTALALNTDIANGIYDRFRSLSFWRPAVLVGSLLGDTLRYTIMVLIVIIVGVILGFRPEAGLSGVLLSLSLVLVFAFSLSWIWTALGLLMDDAESVAMVSGFTTYPLTFLSNVFVDPATMPEFLQAFVSINPVSLVTTALRGLMQGTVTTPQLVYAFLACAILIVVFAPLTMYLYNHKNTT
ncbi:MAG: ABC transporter permease [Chloroflexota bacterium]